MTEVTEENVDEVRSLTDDVLKHALKLQVSAEKLVGDYDGERVEDVFIERVDALFEKADRERKLRVAVTARNIGAQIGSERVADHGDALLRRLKNA